MDNRFCEMRVSEQLHEPLDALEVPVRWLVCARPAFEVGEGKEAGYGGMWEGPSWFRMIPGDCSVY